MCNPHLHLIAALGAPPPLAERIPVLVCAHYLCTPISCGAQNPSHPVRYATLQRGLFFLLPHRELGCGDDTGDDASGI